MYISCKSLWDAGITKNKVGCCGSCHDEAESWPETYPLIEIYENDIGLPRKSFEAKVVGHVCCAVSHFLNDLKDKREVLMSIYEKEE